MLDKQELELEAAAEFERLHHKFSGEQTVTERKRLRRNLAVVFKWICSVISALSAGVLVYSFASDIIPGAIPEIAREGLAVLLGLTGLVCMEWLKITQSSEYFTTKYVDKSAFTKDDYSANRVQLRKEGVEMLLVIAVSFVMSSFGAKAGVKEFSPDAKLIDLQEKLAFYNQQFTADSIAIEQYKSDPSHLVTEGGQKVVQYNLRDELGEMESALTELKKLRIDIAKQVEQENGMLKENYSSKREIDAWKSFGVASILEIIFLLCIRFDVRYQFLRYLELKKSGFKVVHSEPQINATEKTMSLSFTNKQRTLEQMKVLLGQYKYKKKNGTMKAPKVDERIGEIEDAISTLEQMENA